MGLSWPREAKDLRNLAVEELSRHNYRILKKKKNTFKPLQSCLPHHQLEALSWSRCRCPSVSRVSNRPLMRRPIIHKRCAEVPLNYCSGHKRIIKRQLEEVRNGYKRQWECRPVKHFHYKNVILIVTFDCRCDLRSRERKSCTSR